MRIVTWNINSVRLRIELVAKMTKKLKPDVICLQETKCPNDSFPTKAVNKMGFEHVAINGIKGYHGVATLSKLPIEKINIIDYCNQKDGRHIETILDYNGAPLSLHNFYVPAGGDEPDRSINEKFGHKLDFLGEMQSRFTKAKQKTTAQRVLVGDLNIAPYEHDVWSHKQLLNVVSHTPQEVELLEKSGNPIAGLTSRAVLCLWRRSFIRGGATAPKTGMFPIVGGGLTIFGSRQRLAPR